MTVRVDQLSSTVETEPEPSGGGGGEKQSWEEEAELRAHLARVRTLELRTHAWGFDD